MADPLDKIVATSQTQKPRALATMWLLLRRWPWIPGFILSALIVMAVFSPVIQTSNPRIGKLSDRLLPPAWEEEGSAKHFLGTDAQGRDLWSRLVHGARISLTIAAVALSIGMTIGVVLGLAAGYFGGLVDEAIMRLVDTTMSIPPIFIALVFVVTFGQSLSLLYAILALVTWTAFARQVRGQTLALKQSDYVALAQVAGASIIRIMIRHILPGVINTIVVLATLRVGQLIMWEAMLSFLGAGVPPPTPSWGAMIADGRRYVANAWWICFWPGIAILLTVMAFNFIGDWMRDRFDPRLRQL